jgi:hypothetical protein
VIALQIAAFLIESLSTSMEMIDVTRIRETLNADKLNFLLTLLAIESDTEIIASVLQLIRALGRRPKVLNTREVEAVGAAIAALTS